MPRPVMTADQKRQLDALNSDVRFEIRTQMAVDEKGDPKLNRLDNRPMQTQVAVASLYGRHNGQKWLEAESGDDNSAFDAVLEKAKTANRPAATAVELQAENKDLREKLAAAEAEAARLRQVGSSVAVHPGDSQIRRSGARQDAKPAEADGAKAAGTGRTDKA